LITGLQYTCDILRKKAEHFWEIIKIGRTHMQDAVPLTLGQEFSAYLEPFQKSLRRIKRDFGVDVEIDLSAKISDDMINNIIEKWRSEDALGICALAQGGTAVGSGLNTHPEFAHKIAIELTRLTGLPFYSAENKFSEIANIDSILAFSGELNNLATNVMKIANDIRLLASGPRCGIGELQLPENEPGSSIMPGKVNPSQCESITMICAQVMGNHFSTTICGTYGPLELNVFRTCVIHNMLESIEILGEGLRNFTIECLEGIEPNHKRIEYLLENSLMLVTCLNSKIGYDNAAKIARHAFLNDMSLKDAAITLELLSEVEFDDLVDPKKMIRLDEGRKTLTND